MGYRLLDSFESIFAGKAYRHRASTQGDEVAAQLFEDLLALGLSTRFNSLVRAGQVVVNRQNQTRGKKARRGDGTLGDLVPGEAPTSEVGFTVARGPVATVKIGVEVKILAKAMIKQIDRVENDLHHQAQQFRRRGTNAICVAVVGINGADVTTSFEGVRRFKTNGKDRPHPAQEAAQAERRLRAAVAPAYDEFLILPFRATNARPLAFDWTNLAATGRDYGAALARISQEFGARFP